jgi:hypothetical protein
MIICDTRQKQGLFEFGIEIPLRDSRASNTFERLKSHPVLGPKIDEWHIEEIHENITQAGFLFFHHFKKMGRMVFILPSHIFIIDHKHIAVYIGDMSAGHIEILKCSINYLVG